MKKKLLLINPVNLEKDQFQKYIYTTYQPLGLGIIAALTPGNWDVELLDENFEKFSFKKADLVGLTGFTTSANRAYQISAAYRAEGIPTVMGGIHASLMPEEALRFVDTVVTGEAESAWQEVIGDFESGKMQKLYRGEHLTLAGAPRPRRDLFNPGYRLASIQTTRGCPMHCDFCSVSVFNGRKYRKRPVEEVLDELQYIPQKRMFFVDDNLVGSGKEDEERVISLFKGMIERKLKKEWFCQMSINVAENEEVLYYASKSGCKMMLIGIESERERSLSSLGKKMNLRKLNKYKEYFKLINRYGIAIQGGFIFGTDEDNAEDLQCRARYIKKSRIDVMQMTILTPYPGTTLYKKYKDSGRLLYTNYPEDWDRYDMTEVLYKPEHMDHEELKKNMIVCWSSLFNRWNILIKYIKTLIFTKSPVTLLWAVNANRIYRGIFISKIREWKMIGK